MDVYTCPWCPTQVATFESQDESRRFMESHLDSHFAHAIGRPAPEVAA